MHTDAGMLGITESCGHIDFWVNGGVVQPQCNLFRNGEINAAKQSTFNINQTD